MKPTSPGFSHCSEVRLPWMATPGLRPSRADRSAGRAGTATASDAAEASSETAPPPPGGGSEWIRRDPQTLILGDPALGIGLGRESGRGLRQRAGSDNFDGEAIVFAMDDPIVCI